MEFPLWLKLESIIKKLSFSNWFNGWFKYENKKNIEKEINIERVEINYNVSLSINPNEDLKRIDPDVPTTQEIKSDESEFDISKIEFTDRQKSIIEGVNGIHKINGNYEYNFENDYKNALYHIHKKQKNWHITAAAYIANAIQSGSKKLGISLFFESFVVDEDQEKMQAFSEIKGKIEYCYKRLQNLRHTDKNGELKEHMISEYCRKIYNQENIADLEYQRIFIDFENLLFEVFDSYKLK